MGFDREVRRYLFHSYFTEIESNGSQILVRSEYGDEKVGEEIVSARELKRKFKIEEMSSISTLEVAWEHKSLWPRHWTKHISALRVAQTNKLELLKWAREEKKCEWDERTINTAAEQGNLEMVKYCVANECPIDEWACACAARNGHLEVTQILTRRSQSALGLVYCHLGG